MLVEVIRAVVLVVVTQVVLAAVIPAAAVIRAPQAAVIRVEAILAATILRSTILHRSMAEASITKTIARVIAPDRMEMANLIAKDYRAGPPRHFYSNRSLYSRKALCACFLAVAAVMIAEVRNPTAAPVRI
jgi:hypothetical protein